jgi:hypothetical protein
MDCGRYGWMVQWSDGAYTFEKDRADAETCVKFPLNCHPENWRGGSGTWQW